MDWYLRVFELIDMRSFSNLWFWIMLAVIWSRTSHWVLGVPFDLVSRARRGGAQAAADLEILVQISCRRLVYIADVLGAWLTAFATFALASFATLGFGYGFEFGQALFLLVAPLALVAALNMRLARRVQTEATTGPLLWRRIRRLRLVVQAIGLTAIFIAAFWGMWHNMTYSALGG